LALVRQIVNFGVLRNLTKGYQKQVLVPPMPANMKTEILNEKQIASLLKVLDEETDQDAPISRGWHFSPGPGGARFSS
jgi:hypothetical protein